MEYFVINAPPFRYGGGVNVCHELLLDEKVQKLTNSSYDYIKEFIENNSDDEKKALLIMFKFGNQIINQLISYLKQRDDLKMKIIFITEDYWYWRSKPLTRPVLNDLYQVKNYFIITFANNFQKLQETHRPNISQYADKFIYFNQWCCYNTSVPLNDDPIPKIALAGAIGGSYPERQKMRRFKNVVRLPRKRPDPQFLQRLNQYLCCFVSSVYIPKYHTNKIPTNTHVILKKNFEVLGVGSLLLCPASEVGQLNKLGLIKNK